MSEYLVMTRRQPQTNRRRRPMREVWLVSYEDPETGALVEIELDCRRGEFFIEFRQCLLADGLDACDFNLDRDIWDRMLLQAYREELRH